MILMNAAASGLELKIYAENLSTDRSLHASEHEKEVFYAT